MQTTQMEKGTLMALVINPKKEDEHKLSKDEAWAFFDAAVRERLNISTEDFLKRQEEFKCNPHYEYLMFPTSAH